VIKVAWMAMGRTIVKTFTDPQEAADAMTAVQDKYRLQPVGWSWDSEQEWYEVRCHRDDRDYGVDLRGMI
jgi:hypothetical protein